MFRITYCLNIIIAISSKSIEPDHRANYLLSQTIIEDNAILNSQILNKENSRIYDKNL